MILLILLVSGSTVFCQDTTCKKTVELLTNNIVSLELLVKAQEKEIERQDKMILLLTDSIITQGKKIFVLGSINGTLRKKSSKQETWFKIFGYALQGLTLWITSKK